MGDSKSYLLGFCFLLFAVIQSKPGLADDDPPVLPDAYDHAGTGAPMDKPFWQALGNPQLDALVRRGIGTNFDVESARHRIEQSEAVARQMLAPLLPSLSAQAGYNVMPYNAVGPGIEIQTIPGMGASGSDDTQIMHSISTTLNANYLVDITGRNHAARQAALRDAAATKADAQTLSFNLAYLITQAYLGVVYGETQLELVEEQIRTNAELLELVEARFDTATATALDVLQQRQQLESRKSQLPLVEAYIATSKNQLALLSGYSSASELPEIVPNTPDPGVQPNLGAPSRLLHSRPDLRAESARVDAWEERTKSAKRALMPGLALTGQIGYQWNYIDFWDRGEMWGLGVLLTVPIWDGGATHASYKQSEAAAAAARSTFAQNVRAAVEEVESARVRETAMRDHYLAVTRQLESARTAFDKARERYVVGLTEYLNVLVSLGTYQSTQFQSLQAHQDLILARVTLLKALGGEWTKELSSMKYRGE